MELASKEHKAYYFDFHGLTEGSQAHEEEWAKVVKMHTEKPVGSASIQVMQSYQSPITGKWIDTPRQRRDDLARSGSRPWEGREQETKYAQQREKDFDTMLDKTAEKAAIESWQQLAPEKKKVLQSGG